MAKLVWKCKDVTQCNITFSRLLEKYCKRCTDTNWFHYGIINTDVKLEDMLHPHTDGPIACANIGHTHTHTHTSTQTQPYAHIHAAIHTHTRSHTHTYKHEYMQPFESSKFLSTIQKPFQRD